MPLWCLASLVLAQAPSPLAQTVQRLVEAKDVPRLDALLAAPVGPPSPFHVLLANGAYEVGRFGWHVDELASPASGSKFLVLDTALTSEDLGERLFEETDGKLRYIPEADDLGVKIVDHDLTVKFDVPNKSARLEDMAQFAASDAKQPYFFFRMSPQYKVNSIADEAGKALDGWAEAGGVVIVPRPSADSFKLTIDYSAVVNLPRFAGAITDKEASLTNDYWYPMIARHPATYSVAVHAPRSWTAVGQGLKLSEVVNPDERITRFRMGLPVTYFSLSAAPYQSASVTTSRGVRFVCWSTRMTPDAMTDQAILYEPIIRFYGERFEPYVFPQYGAVDSAVYGGGALEAYSFATYGGGLPYEDPHEPSHTWWGGYLNNTYLHSFWNESFADYSEGLYRREVEIGNHEERRRAFISDGGTTSAFDEAAVGSAGVEYGKVADSLGYGKGAEVLQMLESMIGVDGMLQCMKEWLASNPPNHEGEWGQFEAIVVKHHPDTAKFFKDWIWRPGHAKFGADNVTLKLGAASFRINFDGSPYAMPLEVMVQYADGSRETFLRYVGESASQDISLKLSGVGRPVVMSVDPWRKLIREIHADERPTQLNALIFSFERYTDPKHPEYLTQLMARSVDDVPSDPTGKFIVGNPETLPMMKPLCDKVGFEVSGHELTYKGTTVDLRNGGALAVVDLGSGKQCVIGLGQVKVAPVFGRARLAVFDGLGRFLRGATDPKTSGYLTFRP